MPLPSGFRVPFDRKRADRIEAISRRQVKALRLLQSPRYEKLRQATSDVPVSPRGAARAQAKTKAHVAARRKAVAFRRAAATAEQFKQYELLRRRNLALLRESLKSRSLRAPERILIEARDYSRRRRSLRAPERIRIDARDRPLRRTSIPARRRPSSSLKLPARLIVETQRTTLHELERYVAKLFGIPGDRKPEEFGISVTTLYRKIATDRIFVIEFGFPRSAVRNELHNIAFALRRQGRFKSVLPERVFSELFTTVQADSDPDVRRESLWHIADDVEDQDVRVGAAWQIAPPPQGRPLGEGAVIGHPDTGWRSHEQYDEERIDLARSHNVITGQSGGHSAVHELPPHYNLNVTHGTATGSAIVSAQDPAILETVVANPDPGRAEFATNEVGVGGIAPRATIIPIKCVDDLAGVIRIADTNLARAVEYAIDCDVDVISLSLGGIQHRAVREAFESAMSVEQGIIIVAAAGQSYYAVNIFSPGDSVVQPASYQDVVAVAGSTEKRRPWAESHRGENVDITAPGTGVWIADFNADDQAEGAVAGFGTSFSAAITAGAAAIWVGFWGRQHLRDTYPDTPLAHVFHEVLRLSADNRGDVAAHRLTGDWDTDLYGAGILNVERLLSTPLPDTVPPPRSETTGLLGFIGDTGQGAADAWAFMEDLAMESAEFAEALIAAAVLRAQAETDAAMTWVQERYEEALAIADTTAGQIRGYANQAVALVEDVVDEFVETSEELAEVAAEAAEDVVDAAVEVAEGAIDTAEEAAEDVIELWETLWA